MVLTPLAHAQIRPDAGSILQETRPAPDQAPAVTTPPIQAPATPRPAIPAGAGDARVNVTHFIFTGNTELSQEVLQAAVAEWSGKALTFGELIQAVEKIEAVYKAAGFFLAQAILPPQKIRDGAIEIAIAEGRLGETRLEGESRIHPDVLFQFLDRLPKGKALTLHALERQVLLINELAGGKAALDMQAGEAEGTTDIVLAQKPEDLVSGRMEVNNHGSPSTGEKRYSLALNGNSPFNFGERINLMVMTSENRDLKSYNLSGELPIGGDGWRLNSSLSRAEYFVGGIAASSKASGIADSIRVGSAYPLLRSRSANLKIKAELDRSWLKDKSVGVSSEVETGKKNAYGLTFTTSGDMLDEFMGGGSTRADFSMRIGYVAFDPTAEQRINTKLNVPGSFHKSNLSVQRQQTVSQDVSLSLQISYQLAGKNLDTSEMMSMGGPATTPGYANGESSGDSGMHTKLSARWQIAPDLALTLFADRVRLRLNQNPSSGVTTNIKKLTDGGISIDWMVSKDVTASTIIAWAWKENPAATDNDKPRMWFTLGYGW